MEVDMIRALENVVFYAMICCVIASLIPFIVR